MLNWKTLGLSAALTLISAAPALADWQNIANITLYGDMQRGTIDGGGQPARSIMLFADANPLVCRTVWAEFGDGTRTEIFSGPLAQGARVVFDVPDGARTVQRLGYACRSAERTAILRVSLNTPDRGDRGGYGDRDRGGYSAPPAGYSGGDDRTSRYREYDRDPDRSGDLGTLSFSTAYSHQQLDGPDVPLRALSLFADSNPLVCRSISARLSNGETVQIYSGPLAQGQTVYADLPGDARMVRSIDFACRAQVRVALIRVRAIYGARR